MKFREKVLQSKDGATDFTFWIDNLFPDKPAWAKNQLIAACKLLEEESLEYATHGIVIAEILVSLGMDYISIAAGIVYPAFANKILTIEVISNVLGNSIAELINGVHAMNLIHESNPIDYTRIFKKSKKSNLFNLRKLLLAVVDDVRVVLIKLAEHIKDMRFARNQDAKLQIKLALEAKEIYAPIANRLGVGQIKWELEDFALRYLQPEVYKSIATLLDEKLEERDQFINNFTIKLQKILQDENISAVVYGRAKHIYSIWRKMQSKAINYNQLDDIFGLRIVTDTVANCYSILSLIHSKFKQVPNKFNDYIAKPKSNGYKSLHTVVFASSGKMVEIQIRTQEQHDQAEIGVAAHWRYKEGGAYEPMYESKLNELRQLLNWQEELILDNDMVERLRTEFFRDRIYIFTPIGDVKDLPQGATALDFAYHIHTSIGHKTRGAKADGKIIPLTQPLISGTQIEILTVKEGGPSRDWLNPDLGYVATARAKTKISQWFKQQNRTQNIQDGREILQREIRRLRCENTSIKALVKAINACNDEEDLYAGLGCGEIRTSQLAGAITRINNVQPKYETLVCESQLKSAPPTINNIEIAVEGLAGLVSTMAKCCSPIPGDNIVGYIRTGEGISIHRCDCLNILHICELRKDRLIKVAWGGESSNLYLATIVVKFFDRKGLLRDISALLASANIDIKDVETHNNGEQTSIKLTINVANLEALSSVVTKIQQIENVFAVFRVGQ